MTNYPNSTIPKLFDTLDERKITGAQITKATGIPSSTLTSWKKGDRNPKREAVESIADYLNVTADYLYDREPTEMTSDEITLLESFKKLSERDKVLLLAFIKSMQSVEEPGLHVITAEESEKTEKALSAVQTVARIRKRREKQD